VGATPKMGFYFFITKKLSGRVRKPYFQKHFWAVFQKFLEVFGK